MNSQHPPLPNCLLAFTLTELLITIAIIGILATIISPAVKIVQDASKQARCKNNLKQFSIAFIVHQNDNDGFYPNWKYQHAINDYINPDGKIGWNSAAGEGYTVRFARCPGAPQSERGVELNVTYNFSGTTYGWYKGFSESDLNGDPVKALAYTINKSRVVLPSQKCIMTEFWSHTSNVHHWGTNNVNNRNFRIVHNNSSNFLFADGRVSSYRYLGEPNSYVQLVDPMWEPINPAQSSFAQ